jgi:hypothetical protein
MCVNLRNLPEVLKNSRFLDRDLNRLLSEHRLDFLIIVKTCSVYQKESLYNFSLQINYTFDGFKTVLQSMQESVISNI